MQVLDPERENLPLAQRVQEEVPAKRRERGKNQKRAKERELFSFGIKKFQREVNLARESEKRENGEEERGESLAYPKR